MWNFVWADKAQLALRSAIELRFWKKCDFLPGIAILLKKTVNLDNFPSSPSCQIFK
jgi:hypothetical protein